MPRGPNGEKRPADSVGLAVLVGKIATGEVEDARDDKDEAAQERGRKGARARAESLTADQRAKIAKKAAQARWD